MSSFAFAFNNNRYCTHRLRLNVASAEEASSSSSYITREIIYVTSAILARKSGFFRDIFDGPPYNNRNVEDSLIDVPIPLTPEELNPFKQLLHFIYSGQMTSTNPETPLQVLKLAVRYQVQSCCARICEILSPQVDLKLAITFLNIPPDHLNEDVAMLREAVITCVVTHFKDLGDQMHMEQLLQLPLPAMQLVLSRDEVEVPSEDELLHFMELWMQNHNPTQGELEKFLTLIPLIKFRALRCSTLQHILQKFNHNVVVVIPVVEALTSKIQGPHNTQGEVGRRYTNLPVSILKFQQPIEEVEVYMEMEAWAFRVGRKVSSELFDFCGSRFTLTVTPIQVQQNITLRLLVERQAGLEEVQVNFLFAIREPNTKHFVNLSSLPVWGIFRVGSEVKADYVLPENMIGHTLYIKLTLTREENNVDLSAFFDDS